MYAKDPDASHCIRFFITCVIRKESMGYLLTSLYESSVKRWPYGLKTKFMNNQNRKKATIWTIIALGGILLTAAGFYFHNQWIKGFGLLMLLIWFIHGLLRPSSTEASQGYDYEEEL